MMRLQNCGDGQKTGYILYIDSCRTRNADNHQTKKKKKKPTNLIFVDSHESAICAI